MVTRVAALRLELKEMKDKYDKLERETAALKLSHEELEQDFDDRVERLEDIADCTNPTDEMNATLEDLYIHLEGFRMTSDHSLAGEMEEFYETLEEFKLKLGNWDLDSLNGRLNDLECANENVHDACHGLLRIAKRQKYNHRFVATDCEELGERVMDMHHKMRTLEGKVGKIGCEVGGQKISMGSQVRILTVRMAGMEAKMKAMEG